MWLGSSVFDGARAFEGVTPDLERHCARVNASARTMGLEPNVDVETMLGLVGDGLKKFPEDAAIYIRPMYWAEQGGYLSIPADPASTRFLLTMYETPMPPPSGFSITLSPYRRPTVESMPTDAKTGCLYPNNGRAITEARARGFDNALVRDMLGNVVETATSNVFIVKDGVVLTPAPNRSFLAGITRNRVIGLLRESGAEVAETVLAIEDFLDADEIFSSGNYAKVVPITRIEDRVLQPGPLHAKARKLYWEWAHG
jgi:branched-chain amino acid aminotransferase